MSLATLKNPPHADPQRARERIAPLRGDLAQRRGLVEHPLGLLDDLQADRRHRDLGAAAFEERDTEIVLELANGHRQRRLEHR